MSSSQLQQPANVPVSLAPAEDASTGGPPSGITPSDPVTAQELDGDKVAQKGNFYLTDLKLPDDNPWQILGLSVSNEDEARDLSADDINRAWRSLRVKLSEDKIRLASERHREGLTESTLQDSKATAQAQIEEARRLLPKVDDARALLLKGAFKESEPLYNLAIHIHFPGSSLPGSTSSAGPRTDALRRMLDTERILNHMLGNSRYKNAGLFRLQQELGRSFMESRRRQRERDQRERSVEGHTHAMVLAQQNSNDIMTQVYQLALSYIQASKVVRFEVKTGHIPREEYAKHRKTVKKMRVLARYKLLRSQVDRKLARNLLAVERQRELAKETGRNTRVSAT